MTRLLVFTRALIISETYLPRSPRPPDWEVKPLARFRRALWSTSMRSLHPAGNSTLRFPKLTNRFMPLNAANDSAPAGRGNGERLLTDAPSQPCLAQPGRALLPKIQTRAARLLANHQR